MTHTPGPWEVKYEMNVYAVGRNRSICSMGFQDGTEETHIANKANAHLIAAAPQMYNLLYSLKEIVSQADEATIDEVLAKAEGRL